MEILIYLGKVSLLLLTFLLIHQLLLKRDSFVQANRFFLLVGIAVSLSLPLMVFTQVEIIEIQKTEIPAPMQLTYMENPSINPNPSPVIKEKAFIEKLDTADYIVGIYILGVLFFFFKMLHQSRILGQLIRQCKKHHKDGIVYCEAKESIEAFSFFKFMVYNPQLHQANELEIIKAHERVHIKEWHSIDMIVSHLVQIALWFNPFSYWFSSTIEENLEFIADAKAVQQINSVKKYQYTLVNYLSGNAKNAYASYFFKKSSLKNRIIMLNQEKSPTCNLLKFSLVLPLLFGFIWMFQTETLAKEVYVEAEKTTAVDTSLPLEKSGEIEPKKETSPVFQQDSTSVTTMANIAAQLNKNTTDKSLENLESFFEEHDQKLQFSKVKRNKSGEITRIKIKFSDSKNGVKKELYVSGNEPIKDLIIKRDFDNGTAEIAEYQEPEKDLYTLLNEAQQIYINGEIYQKNANLAITDVSIEEILDDVIKISGQELDETNIGKIYKQFEDEDTERIVYLFKAVEDALNKETMVMRLEINKGKNPFSMNFESEYDKDPREIVKTSVYVDYEDDEINKPIDSETEDKSPNKYVRTNASLQPVATFRNEIEERFQKVDYLYVNNERIAKRDLVDKILLYKNFSLSNEKLAFSDAELLLNNGGENIADIIIQIIGQNKGVYSDYIAWFKTEDKIQLASIDGVVNPSYTSIEDTFILSKDAALVDVNYFKRDKKPIFVVDGKIVDEESMRKINPTSIDSISVLKSYKMLPENLKANPFITEEEFSGLVQIELKEKTSEDDFEILVTRTKEGLSMKCNTGCAWKELSFSLGNITQHVNASGVSNVFRDDNTTPESLANFHFKIRKDGNQLKLTKIEGTIWEDLSFSLQENETYVLTQNGVTKK